MKNEFCEPSVELVTLGNDVISTSSCPTYVCGGYGDICSGKPTN